MQSDNRLLDDLARVISGAMGATAGLRGDMEARLREPLDRVVQRLQLVSREEFEVVREMAETARDAQEALSERVASLEAELAALKATPATKSRARATKTKAPAGDAS
ncbi:MAG: hypothetical protein Kilf2KO_02900 [Rhodospirillales bacterium]